jgi:cation diffusion facilitator CzcD-associated flavoprotein CzcO
VIHDVLVVGGKVAGFTTLDRPVIGAVFDDDTNTWTLTTDDHDICRTRLLLARESPLQPWIPNLPGRTSFRGESFHATAIAPNFDPAAQRIAVVGADSAAGRLVGKLTRSAASVKVFPLPPRRAVRPTRGARRYLRRRPELVPWLVDAVTASGIRTVDGALHQVDTIIYGTGFAVSAECPTLVGTGGLTLQQAWPDGAEPYLGVAMHGFPNYFMLGEPDTDTALRCVTNCLHLMAGHHRIEVRRSAQRVFNERVHLRGTTSAPTASAFDLSSPGGMHDDLYDGPATLTLADISQQVRVRLAGHIDPIDGQYHWQGVVFDELPTDLLTKSRTVGLAVGDQSAAARITEKTPQGTHSIAGVGAPPFGLPDIELTVPQR